MTWPQITESVYELLNIVSPGVNVSSRDTKLEDASYLSLRLAWAWWSLYIQAPAFTPLHLLLYMNFWISWGCKFQQFVLIAYWIGSIFYLTRTCWKVLYSPIYISLPVCSIMFDCAFKGLWWKDTLLQNYFVCNHHTPIRNWSVFLLCSGLCTIPPCSVIKVCATFDRITATSDMASGSSKWAVSMWSTIELQSYHILFCFPW
jgi:hypothetical protein